MFVVSHVAKRSGAAARSEVRRLDPPSRPCTGKGYGGEQPAVLVSALLQGFVVHADRCSADMLSAHLETREQRDILDSLAPFRGRASLVR